jgi:hypothetical protein
LSDKLQFVDLGRRDDKLKFVGHQFSGFSVSSDTSLSGIETLYSSVDHLARSMTRHLSEQKGLLGLSCHLVGFPQIGHFTINPSVQESLTIRA